MKRTFIAIAALLLAPLAAQCAEPTPQPSTQPNSAHELKRL